MAQVKIVPESIKLLKISDHEYFSAKYNDYLSNSKIGMLNPDEGGSVEKFLEGFKSEFNNSFALGGAIHGMLLIPDEFEISDIRKPSGKLGEFAEAVVRLRRNGMRIYEALIEASIEANYYSGSLPNLITKARTQKNNKRKFKSSKRMSDAIRKSIDFYLKRYKVVDDPNSTIETIYLSEKNFETYTECMKGVEKSNFENYLRPQGFMSVPDSYNEYAIFCDIEYTDDEGKVTIVKFKGKIDNFTVDHEEKVITLNDLKTTGKPVRYFMGNHVVKDGETNWYNGSFQTYRYYRQFGIYFWMLSAALKQIHGLHDYSLKANILVVETIPEYNSKVYKVTNNHIQAGLTEFKQLLGGYVKVKNGDY